MNLSRVPPTVQRSRAATPGGVGDGPPETQNGESLTQGSSLTLRLILNSLNIEYTKISLETNSLIIIHAIHFSTESSPPKDDLTKETVAQIEMVTETKTVTLIEPHEEKQNSVEEKAEEVRELDIVEELDSREFLPEEPQSPPQIIETPEQGDYHK